MSEKIIGIDLGTTNSCVAIMKGDKAQVLEDMQASWGPKTTPSVVAFPKDGKGDVLVGEPAKESSSDNHPPQSTFYAFKRLMGRRFHDEEVQCHIKKVSYSIVEADNGDAWVEINGEDRSPPEISARVLQEMKRIAEDHLLGEEIKSAVITVPAYFNDSQRQATKDAGRIAGLDVKRIIDEPTAAALAYGMDRWCNGSKIAIYDLGGGTFDISIIEMTEIDGERHIDVKAINGDTFLGGVDFDDCIIEHVCSEFKKDQGVDPRNIKDSYARTVALSRLRFEVEKAKVNLSHVKQRVIYVPNIASDQKHLKVLLTRSKLESLVEDLIIRTVEPCRIAMKDAGISPTEIDKVILVGGQTRMPKVQEVVRSIFGKEPRWGVNPDEAVAIGAALAGNGKMKALNVTSHSLGIQTEGGNMARLIDKNTKIPIKESQNFTTVEDNQRTVLVNVLEGEYEGAADNKLLGHFELEEIPLAPGGEPRIKVTFNIDDENILTVSAKDMDTGNECSIRVTGRSGLSDKDIERMTKELKAASIEESDRDGWTPLHEAAWNGDFEAVKGLVNAGADPNATNNHGHTPLHLAAFNGHLVVVQKLVDAGSEPNAKDEKGETPLHKAAYHGHFGAIKALVKVGANVEATLPDGTKPSDIAAEQGHSETFAAAVAAAAD